MRILFYFNIKSDDLKLKIDLEFIFKFKSEIF